MPDRRKDYVVGKGRPPVATRFKSGQSGNPRGRPKGAKNATAMLRDALAEKVSVVKNGRRTRITKLDLIVNKLVNDAAQGNPVARKQVLDLLRIHPELVREPTQRISSGMSPSDAAKLYAELLRKGG